MDNGAVGLLFFPAFDWAISPTHPEREERLLYTKDQIVEEGILDLDEIVEYAPRIAEEKDIARVHVCVPDVAAQATEAHRIAVGGALAMADAWQTGECDDCPGWLRIDSRARGGPVGGQRIWAMSVPLLACERCAEEGRAQYHDAARNPTAPYDWIYLQDRPADEYHRYDLASQQERTLA